MQKPKKSIDRIKVKEMLKSGMTCYEVAREEGCSQSSVERIRRILREEDETYEDQRNRIDEGKVWALGWARWPIPDIARECYCSEGDVIRILAERVNGAKRARSKKKAASY